MIPDDTIRAGINGSLGELGVPPTPLLTDAEWEFLEREGRIRELRTAKKAALRRLAERAARTIRNYRATLLRPEVESQPARPMLHRQPRDAFGRREILSRLLALEAERNEDVVSYRCAHLGGSVLAWEDVGEWVERKVSERDHVTEYVTFILPEGTETRLTSEGVVFDPPLPNPVPSRFLERRCNILTFARPGDRWVTRVPTGGEALDRLQSLSESLAKHYGWSEDQATLFVLTGITPLLPSVRVQVSQTDSLPSAAARLTLTIDPLLSQAEVAEQYGRMRQKIIGGRYRPQTEQHLELALFAAEQGRLTWGDVTDEEHAPQWKELLAIWNERHPDRRRDPESGLTNFARDCKDAQTRLLFPRLNTWEALAGGTEEDQP